MHLVKTDKIGKTNAVPEFLKAKIGESLSLVLSRHVETYTQLVKVHIYYCELILSMGTLTRFLKIDPSL